MKGAFAIEILSLKTYSLMMKVTSKSLISDLVLVVVLSSNPFAEHHLSWHQN